MTHKKILQQKNMFELNAEGQSIGRLASRAAIILTGKNSPDYQPNKISGNIVIISNIHKVAISEKSLDNKIIYHVSGYPGGLKKRKWRDVFSKDPKQLFLKVISNMIPANKLKKKILKNIRFT